MRLDTVTIITVRESALKNWLLEKKIPCRTGESNLRQRRDGPTLHQLSYIPNPNQGEKRERDRQTDRRTDLETAGDRIVCVSVARASLVVTARRSIMQLPLSQPVTVSVCLCQSLSLCVFRLFCFDFFSSLILLIKTET